MQIRCQSRDLPVSKGSQSNVLAPPSVQTANFPPSYIDVPAPFPVERIEVDVEVGRPRLLSSRFSTVFALTLERVERGILRMDPAADVLHGQERAGVVEVRLPAAGGARRDVAV